MKGEDTTFRDELRDIETGWVPWVLAAVYFPVYILLDFTAGELAATRLGLPQSVAVGLLSLTVSGVVVLLFVLANLRQAVRRPRHSMGSSSAPLRRGVRSLVSPITRGLGRLLSTLAAVVLTVFVGARDGVALVLAGIWTVVAGVGGVVYRVLALLARPFVLATVVVSRPPRAAASRIGGALRRDEEPPADELDEPVDRRELEAASPAASPLRRSDATSDGGTEPVRNVGAADDLDGDDEPADGQAAAAERDDAEAVVDTTDRVEPDVEAAADAESGGDADEQVVPGDPSGDSRADDGEPPTDDKGDSGEQAVDQPEEDEWPDEWISATDV